MIAATAAAKKAACKAGLTGPAAQVAETALKMAEIKFELDGITYESEVANAAPLVVNTVVDLIKSVGFLELMKLLKCFAAGTQVVVATEQINGVWNYRTAAIETLKVGDLVLAREEYGSQIKRQRVEETFARVSDHLRVLEFRDAVGSNQTIKTTDEHPIWSHDQAKYILANALAVGANVIGPNGELQTLVDSRREEFTQGTPVYNFRVSEYQTYYVAQNIDGTPLLVHNARCGAGANSTNNGSLKAKSGDLEEAARKAREFNPKPGKSVAANKVIPEIPKRIPASEKQAVSIAKQIEKDLGKQARREFHDMKDAALGDRTINELRMDAQALYEQFGKEIPKWLQ